MRLQLQSRLNSGLQTAHCGRSPLARFFESRLSALPAGPGPGRLAHHQSKKKRNESEGPQWADCSRRNQTAERGTV